MRPIFPHLLILVLPCKEVVDFWVQKHLGNAPRALPTASWMVSSTKLFSATSVRLIGWRFTMTPGLHQHLQILVWCSSQMLRCSTGHASRRSWTMPSTSPQPQTVGKYLLFLLPITGPTLPQNRSFRCKPDDLARCDLKTSL